MPVQEHSAPRTALRKPKESGKPSKEAHRLLHPKHSRGREAKKVIPSPRLALGGLEDDADGALSASPLPSRAKSPTPSVQSLHLSQESSSGQQSPRFQHGKRGIRDLIRKHLPGTSKTPLESSVRSSRNSSRRDLSPHLRPRHHSYDDSGSKVRGIHSHRFRLRDHLTDKDSGHGPPEEESFWPLDTDLRNMEGIISEPRPESPLDQGRIFDGDPSDDVPRKDPPVPVQNWDPPDSWFVKKHGDDMLGALPYIDDEINTEVHDDGLMYFIRVFRVDSTFATLSAPLNATVADILDLLGKKSFLQDGLNNYELVIRKRDLSRQLEHGERPILIQKRLLKQVGYTSKDRIEDVGRDDHSYICRFVFLPIKLSGNASLDSDPGFNMNQKFTHVDLAGRNLVTIPITLYKKAHEIFTLDLSRNLALDVPSDFIRRCIHLQEIKFIGNEAWRLPPSFSLATRLTSLDVSSNRLEDLSYTNLDRLRALVNIRLANNKLNSLPAYFGSFSSLRRLDLSSNEFTVFPQFLCELTNLTDLDLSFNQIRELPDIGRLVTLERLYVTNNRLTGTLDESFQKLINIKEIDARFNQLTNVDSVMHLPRLEKLALGHNAIAKFKGSFPRLQMLELDHCPITQFELDTPVTTLTYLNIASAKLVQFKDSLFDNMPNLTKLILDKNHFVSLSPHIGKLRFLEYFSMTKNPLSSLPPTIGCLTELRYLNLRECNLSSLPSEIWFCLKLETLNVSSNILDTFPKYSGQPPLPPGEYSTSTTPAATPGLSHAPSYENMGAIDEEGDGRRPSTSSPGAGRKNSMMSNVSTAGGARKASTASRNYPDGSAVTMRKDSKDSNFSQRITTTFAGSLRNLYLADNRLEDDVFRELSYLPELRVLNLSYNDLTELPHGILKRWQLLTDLYLSGNELSSLPSDDLEETSNLRTLHLNANRFQVLPAELCKVSKLSVLDVGSNSLKYNVSNWPYDWNWNWNHNLKYLNFSGNKRLEIKPNIAALGPPAVNGTDLTGFSSLPHLRVLGLMDVTLTTKTVPEEDEDRRVRTSASLAGSLMYGMADYLGNDDHLSIIDMMVPQLRHDDNMDTLVGMFDGQARSGGGSKVAKFLHENFTRYFVGELKKMKPEVDTPLDALRRTFLGLNRDMAAAASKNADEKDVRQHIRGSTATAKLLNQDDLQTGGVATVLYLRDMDLYVGNVGDAQAVLVKSDGNHKPLTFNHDPAEPHEHARIRAAGGYVSRNGKLNDALTVSRAFGYFHMVPSVIAAPHTAHFTLTEQDEMIIMASREVWDHVTPDVVVDVARADRHDLMVAAQKIRDLAIAFGASSKLMVMILGVSQLKKRERITFKGTSLTSMGPMSPFPEGEIITSAKRARKPRGPGDSRLARLDYVDAPVGELAIIFTDIKQSTALWETCPDAMRSAIQIHNDILRRQLGIVGGYEVKTEGDAFMVAFATTTAALLWCFNCQMQLLEAEWPIEILEQPQCKEVLDQDGNVIFRGLSVRMGIHYGEPVCEKDPVTNRMDYFGPMVNRASRISAVADGGQIFVSSDFMGELQRTLERFADAERSPTDTEFSEHEANIRRELQQLNSQGFVIKDQGERKLKGLENPESVFLIYPHALAGRLAALEDVQSEQGDSPAKIAQSSKLNLSTDILWQLWEVTLRLEAICSSLEMPGQTTLNNPNRSLVNAIKRGGGEFADSAIVGLIDMQVTRIEVGFHFLSFLRDFLNNIANNVYVDLCEYPRSTTHAEAIPTWRYVTRPCHAHGRGVAAAADAACRAPDSQGAARYSSTMMCDAS